MLATFYYGKTPKGAMRERLIRKTLELYLKENIEKRKPFEEEKLDYKALASSDSVIIERTEKGKPYFVMRETKFNDLKLGSNIYFSISHTGKFWICLMAGDYVGVDIQEERKASGSKLAERFFAEEEKEYIRVHGDAAFFRVWTMKEAFVKCLGEGIGYGLDKFSVAKDGSILTLVEGLAINEISLALEIRRAGYIKTEGEGWPLGAYCTKDLTKIKFVILNEEKK